MLQTETHPAQPDTAAAVGANVAHLMSQIKFLHNEVDRLEEQLSSVRTQAYKEAKDVARQYERVVEQKDAELREWRSKAGFLKGEADLAKRCGTLEKQLALVNSEKSVLNMEKNDLQAKVRKVEAQLKSKKSELNESVKSATEDGAATKERLTRLKVEIEHLRSENAKLKEQREKTIARDAGPKPETKESGTSAGVPTSSTGTQTAASAPTVRDAECQVQSTAHFTDPENRSVHVLYEALEKKTQESDGYRAQLDDLQEVGKDIRRALDTTKKRLAEEVERRRLVNDDAEKLSVQVKSLQQKCSALASSERNLCEKVRGLEEQRQALRVEAMRAEREKTDIEDRLQQYEKDMEHLASNKNYSNQQLSVLANENESLRAEVQRMMVRESQLTYSLKAKDVELQEILDAYQNAAKETDTILESQRFLERELDNARATLAAKEERIIFLQEQVNGLHQREQQLVLDLQAMEYENDQLHRKVIQSDGGVGQLESKCVEMQQFLYARDQTIEELHQSLAELSKQVVIKENEAMLLRRRCDSLETDISQLQLVASSETARSRELEEANARLVTRDVLSSYNEHESVSQELETVKAQLSVFQRNAEVLSGQLESEEARRKALEKELEKTKVKLQATNDSKDRLEQIVLDQTRALSTLSQ